MSANAAAVMRLRTVLEAEERLYLELRGLLQRERELIANLDAVALEDLVREKESLAEEARLLEESRIEIAAELAALCDLPAVGTSLSQLCDALGEDGPGGLRDAHSRLAALVGAVQELLRANSLSAGEAHTRVEATLQLLGRLLPETPTYTPHAAPSTQRSGGRLVRRAV